MKIKQILLLPILILLGVFYSCKKEKGCTDSKAINHTLEAEEDDGSGEYEASVIFWFDEETSNKIVADSIESLTIRFHNSESSVIIPATTFYTTTPVCSKDNIGTIKHSLTDTISLRSSNCEAIKLNY